MYDAFLYIVANEGIDTSASYPYSGKVHVYPVQPPFKVTSNKGRLLRSVANTIEALYKGHFHNPSVSFLQRFHCTVHCVSLQQLGCSYSVSERGARISSSISIESGSESALQSAVANIGPIAVAVDARSSAFRVRKSHYT